MSKEYIAANSHLFKCVKTKFPYSRLETPEEKKEKKRQTDRENARIRKDAKSKLICDAKDVVSKYSDAELSKTMDELCDGLSSDPAPGVALTLYDGEQEEQEKESPYKIMKNVVNRRSGVPTGIPETATIPFQYELIRAFFSSNSTLQISPENRSRIKRIDALVFQASEKATALISEMLVGWKTSLVQIEESNATKFKTAPNVTEDDFWNWNPSKPSYRAFSVVGGESVQSYRNEFLSDFVTNPKGQNEHKYKENCLSDHPFIKQMVRNTLESRKDEIKRGVGQIDSEGKKHRHPCIGPLEIHDYRLFETEITDASKGCDVSRNKIQTQFPGKLDDIVSQYEFESKLVNLCNSVNEAYSEYAMENDENGVLESDEIGLYVIFCLTHTPRQKGGEHETCNRLEYWYIRILRELIIMENPTLKQKYYTVSRHGNSGSNAGSSSVNKKRHTLKRSNDQVYSEMMGRINGWVDSALIGFLQPFYLNRIRAFQASNLLFDQKMKRDDHLKFLHLYRNAVDSFDDVSKRKKFKRDQTIKRTVINSLTVAGSISEESSLEFDALVLTIVAIGRKATTEKFKSDLEKHQISFTEETVDDSVNTCRAVELVNSETNIWSNVDEATTNDEKIEKAEINMSRWLYLQQRCGQTTLKSRIDNAISKLSDALKQAELATKSTKLVEKEYNIATERDWAERKRINSLPIDVRRTIEETVTVNNTPDVQLENSLKYAIESALPNVLKFPGAFCLDKTGVSLKLLVGQPPNWLWDTGESEAKRSDIHQTLQSAIIERFRKAFESYKLHVESLTSSKPYIDKLIDFVSPLEKEVDLITAARFNKYSQDEEPDFIGFAVSPKQASNIENAIKWLEDRVERMSKSPNEFVEILSVVIHYGFYVALQWAGIFSKISTKLNAEKKPRMGIAVLYIIKVLSIASVAGGICTDKQKMDLFLVSDERIEIASVESISAYAKKSTDSWKCVCSIAAFTQQLLVFNRAVHFDSTKYKVDFEQFQEFATVSFSEDSFLVLDNSKIDEFKNDVNSYLIKAAPEVEDFPPSFDWSFCDLHWTTPAAFRVLLTWLPESAHQLNGFFLLSGVRERPSKNSGFLNVRETIQSTTYESDAQYWDGLYTHEVSMTHGRLPTPP